MNTDKLKSLALSDTGFLFDPVSGSTFTMNETGVRILSSLKAGKSREETVMEIMSHYDVEKEDADRDYSDFLVQLNQLGLVE
ncbi:MAG TPA: HPr-rel-A system PqqD family peptide chaperone [Leptospiraceae bacterium]|nr:HPr-rel-A system PqqD family peptide chaperone [Leptospiraceae bacterium]HMY69338.1 HPr-rel-A system PqqD family peptide chaperone [Leptospiraceae bacterium]HNF15862.1 HPr-rel-A system PqqD family peptide chaperone [Leptospiraceae bacterium]HNF23496.1 HPr-rel-A system PqqD family peptide chaperone [Leptospiraceae bacterium]HNI96542.1 HPr-rel-A system PqqD family peptide chaperone [Leptospiraceae bacterium]